MKNPIPKPLFLFLLLIGFTSILTVESSYFASQEYFMSANSDIVKIIIDEKSNETLFYCYIEVPSTLNLQITALKWGERITDDISGLLIEILDDDDSFIKGWMILIGDTQEHRFTSETHLNGTVQLKLTIINVEDVEIEWGFLVDIPVWTYSMNYNVLTTNKLYFGLERSSRNYEVIENLCLNVHTNIFTNASLNITFSSETNRSIHSIDRTFENNTQKLVTIHIEEGINNSNWYGISASFDDDCSKNISLNFELFYDRWKPENIVRVFLNTGQVNLSQIPFDLEHMNSEYSWSIFDKIPAIPPTPLPKPVNEIILIVLSVIFTPLFVAFLLIYAINKRKSVNEESDEYYNKLLPSKKYVPNKNAVYNPQPTFNVNFSTVPTHYTLESTNGSQLKCDICYQPIKENDEITRCPSCDVAFHKNHLYHWIFEHLSCPVCKAHLRLVEHD